MSAIFQYLWLLLHIWPIIFVFKACKIFNWIVLKKKNDIRNCVQTTENTEKRLFQYNQLLTAPSSPPQTSTVYNVFGNISLNRRMLEFKKTLRVGVPPTQDPILHVHWSVIDKRERRMKEEWMVPTSQQASLPSESERMRSAYALDAAQYRKKATCQFAKVAFQSRRNVSK